MLNNYDNIITINDIGAIIIALSILASTIIICFTSFKIRKQKNNLESFYKDLEISADRDIPEFLENVTTETITLYLNIHPEYSAPGIVITEEMELALKHEIAKLMAQRISPTIYKRLAMYYNKQYMAEIISEKISIIITDFVVSTNTKSTTNIPTE